METKGQLVSVVWKLTVSYGCMHQLFMNFWQMGKNKQKTKLVTKLIRKFQGIIHIFFSRNNVKKESRIKVNRFA